MISKLHEFSELYAGRFRVDHNRFREFNLVLHDKHRIAQNLYACKCSAFLWFNEKSLVNRGVNEKQNEPIIILLDIP